MTDDATLPVDHPAKFSPSILAELIDIANTCLPNGGMVLDPFAGIGTIHELRHHTKVMTVGVELEPEWAIQGGEWTLVGDSTELTDVLSGWVGQIDAVMTSPAYGNRMADSYDGRDGSKRITYRVALGRLLHRNNGASMHFGFHYKRLHYRVWKQCRDMLIPGGLMVVNVKDFIRKGKVVPVVDWHHATLERLGFVLLEDRHVGTPGMRYGANGQARVDGEHILVMRKAA